MKTWSTLRSILITCQILSDPPASNSYDFLRFFDEASQSEDFVTQRPVLEVDDIVVDNLAAHHTYCEAERAMRDFFNDIGLELNSRSCFSQSIYQILTRQWRKVFQS